MGCSREELLVSHSMMKENVRKIPYPTYEASSKIQQNLRDLYVKYYYSKMTAEIGVAVVISK